ncbi:Probable magnesium transporter NIPA2 [Linum perenne]
MGMSRDNLHGLILAVSSSIFIGSSFIVKKKGLKKAADNGTRAGLGGYSYLYQPWWWAGMITMILGEIANFAAYAFAPAILVTPLGALSIIFSAVLAHFILQEKLHIFGVLGCVLCVVGSSTIVLHAPQERSIESVRQVWQLATEPGFLVYSALVVIAVSVLIFYCVPRYGQTHMIVYVGICSLMGSLTVMSVKAVSIALKLSFSGMNQFTYFETWIFTIIVVTCCLLQINYLNKDWDSQNASQIATELCGFVTILSGTFLLHRTKDMGDKPEEEEAPVFPNTSNRTPETNV